MYKKFEAVPEDESDAARDHQANQLVIDCEHYQNLLDCPHLTDEDRIVFLQALWSVISAFIDLGYGVGPAQLAEGSRSLSALCERELSILTKTAA